MVWSAAVAPQAQFGDRQRAPVVGGDVELVVSVGGGVADVVGVLLHPIGEGLVAL